MRIENRGRNLLKDQVAGGPVKYKEGEYWVVSATWSGWGNVYMGLGISGSSALIPENFNDLLPYMNTTLYLYIEDAYAITASGTKDTTIGLLINWGTGPENTHADYFRNSDGSIWAKSFSTPFTWSFNPADYIPSGTRWHLILRNGANDGCTLYVKRFQLTYTLEEYKLAISDYLEITV